MRLLHTEKLQLETFHTADVPDYAILSHTWGNDEVTFQDLHTDVDKKKKGWSKILGSASEAVKHDCKYVWIDTCCIDKTSSSELSEAINSMFRWYQDSKVCFAYIEDYCEEIKLETFDQTLMPDSPIACKSLYESRWFTRGWTLQELIAPKILFFYDLTWNKVGEKQALREYISRATGIDTDVLHDPKLLLTKSIARRMSWESERETTRSEDIAYCLMGIFDVNMPLLYGEGEKAFIRLQEEIMRSSYDHTLFAWDHTFPRALSGAFSESEKRNIVGVGILAPHPDSFVVSADIVPHAMKTEPYAMTNRGLQIHLRVFKHEKSHLNEYAILQCRFKNNLGTAIAIPIAQIPGFEMRESYDEFCRDLSRPSIEVQYSQATSLDYRRIYLRAAGPLFAENAPSPSYRCWLREYGKELGIRFQKARYCQFNMHSMDPRYISGVWDYKTKSMSWDTDWDGVHAALLFSKKRGPEFVVVLTISHPRKKRDLSAIADSTMRIHVEPVSGIVEGSEHEPRNQVSIDQILTRQTVSTEDDYHIAEASATYPFEDRLMTVRLKKESVFDEFMFVLDLSFSGVKRQRSDGKSHDAELHQVRSEPSTQDL